MYKTPSFLAFYIYLLMFKVLKQKQLCLLLYYVRIENDCFPHKNLITFNNYYYVIHYY